MGANASVYADVVLSNSFAGVSFDLSDLQRAMLDATPDCIKILSVDGKLLAMNKAGCLALGVPQESEFGMPWLPLLPEGVHACGLEALRTAAEGQGARFPGESLSADGALRYWDNLLTPIISAAGAVQWILCVSRDVTARTLLERELEDAIAREKLLAREMHHRIKNVFAVVSGLITLSEKEAQRDTAPEPATKILRGKLGALSRASDTAFAFSDDAHGAAGPADLMSLVSAVLQPYGDRCSASGSQLAIGRETVTMLALLLHELATNSVKYGALSADRGAVAVRWRLHADAFELTWTENGGPPMAASPRREGFGGEMVERIVHAAGGEVARTWKAEGLVARLRLPTSALA